MNSTIETQITNYLRTHHGATRHHLHEALRAHSKAQINASLTALLATGCLRTHAENPRDADTYWLTERGTQLYPPHDTQSQTPDTRRPKTQPTTATRERQGILHTLEHLAAGWVEYAENSGVEGEAAEAYRACARELEDVATQAAPPFAACGHCGSTSESHTVDCPVVAPFSTLVASELRVEDDLRLASDEGENHATPLGVVGWYAEVNLGEIHPRRASQLLRHVAIARPGGSECDQLLLSLSRQLAETAREADRDHPGEAGPMQVFQELAESIGKPELIDASKIHDRIIVGPPYSERTITIDPETGIQIPLEHGGVLHMPPAGGFHTDVDPEVCRLHPFVGTLSDHLGGGDVHEVAYELAVWLNGAGYDRLQAFFAAPMAVDQEPKDEHRVATRAEAIVAEVESDPRVARWHASTLDDYDADLFERVGRAKLRCRFCDHSGYPGGLWGDPCVLGHPFECDDCERKFSTKGRLTAHRRSNH